MPTANARRTGRDRRAQPRIWPRKLSTNRIGSPTEDAAAEAPSGGSTSWFITTRPRYGGTRLRSCMRTRRSSWRTRRRARSTSSRPRRRTRSTCTNVRPSRLRRTIVSCWRRIGRGLAFASGRGAGDRIADAWDPLNCVRPTVLGNPSLTSRCSPDSPRSPRRRALAFLRATATPSNGRVIKLNKSAS
jgi:hypothetical protein